MQSIESLAALLAVHRELREAHVTQAERAAVFADVVAEYTTRMHPAGFLAVIPPLVAHFAPLPKASDEPAPKAKAGKSRP